MLKLAPAAAPIQKDLKDLRNANCPSRDKFAFSMFDLSNPNFKKKSMRAREENGGWKMSPLKIPLESQLQPININTRYRYPWKHLEIHRLALGNPAVHGSF